MGYIHFYSAQLYTKVKNITHPADTQRCPAINVAKKQNGDIIDGFNFKVLSLFSYPTCLLCDPQGRFSVWIKAIDHLYTYISQAKRLSWLRMLHFLVPKNCTLKVVIGNKHSYVKSQKGRYLLAFVASKQVQTESYQT